MGKLESAYKSLSKEIYANAVARSYADKIADISIKKDQELIKAQNQYVSYLNAQKTLDKAIANLRKSQGKDYDVTNNEAIRNQMKFVEEQKQLWLDLRANVKQYDENIEAISNHINTLDLFPQPEEETYDYWKQQQERAEGVLKKIKSDVKKTLDEAAKEGKDLFSLGVDKDIVKNYQDAVKQLKESQEAESV